MTFGSPYKKHLLSRVIITTLKWTYENMYVFPLEAILICMKIVLCSYLLVYIFAIAIVYSMEHPIFWIHSTINSNVFSSSILAKHCTFICTIVSMWFVHIEKTKQIVDTVQAVDTTSVLSKSKNVCKTKKCRFLKTYRFFSC